MKKNKIEEELKKNFADEYTIKMFTNFVMEFQECFGDIMPTEEVLNRININVQYGIKIVEELTNKHLDGKYDKDGIVYLKKKSTQNEKYIKYLLFHELLHALTEVRDKNGKEIMDGFSYINNCYGMGLNEAMTEYLTQIRNEKFEENRKELISGYRTITEQMRRMLNILDKQKILHYYFYEPEKFKDYINSQEMNYDEIELAFRYLSEKDDDVYNIGHGKKINNNNYHISNYSRIIFDNYSKSIGEVNSLEDFENKYKIFQTYVDGNCDCLTTIFITYYNSIGKDINRLLSLGISFDKIRETLNQLNLSLDGIKNMYNISKLFVNDKNQTAINLYNLYKKNPLYYINLFAQNYAYIFDYFREADVCPGNELYDFLRYPLIGSFLKKHSTIDFSDVSYIKVEEPKSKINCYFFYSSDMKLYGYTPDGKEVSFTEDKEQKRIFEFKVNELCICKLIFDKNHNLSFSFEAKNGFNLEDFMKEVKFSSTISYSEKSDIEYWIANNEDIDPKYIETLKKIESRIADRQGKSYID